MIDSTRNKVEKVIIYALLMGLGFLLLSPFIYMISISLATPSTVQKMDFGLFPKEFHVENYKNTLTDLRIMRWFLNSCFLVIFSIFGQLFSSSFVAFGFARLRAKGKNILFLIMLSTMMIPSQITMIPQFIIFKEFGWINTLLPIIIPNFFGGAFNIFLVRQFIMGIPTSLDEAAKIDGLGYIGVYSRIILPLIKPILAAVAIFTFNYNWGAFMEPLIYINDTEKMPLALGVQILSTTTNAAATPEWNIVMVSSMLLTIPMVILFFFGQKYLFEANISFSSGASK